MFERPDGEWEIIPFANSVPSDEYVDMLDRWRLQEFLRLFKADFWIMSRLRVVLYQSGPVSRYTDDEVIEQIAARLVSRELLFRRHLVIRTGSEGGGRSEGSQHKAAASLGPSSRAAKVEEPEANTFFNNNGKAQAASLLAAAASGVPFCEECQKGGQASN